MTISLLPTVLVGLGAFGNRVLNRVAVELRQGYGDAAFDHVALLSFDFPTEPDSGQDSAVHYYSLFTDPQDWLRNKTLAASAPYLKSWFDADYYCGRVNITPDHIEDRQLGRLVFLRHLMHDSQALHAFLYDHISTITSQHRESRIVVYVLGSYCDMAMSALLTDVANFMRLAVEHVGKMPYLQLYAALPTAFGTLPSDNAAANQAANFAALRELERYSTGGDDLAELQPFYPYGSDFEVYNTTNRLFNIIRIFTAPPANKSNHRSDKAALVECWTASLSALLTEDFGSATLEVLVNQPALSGDELHVGSHRAAMVTLPLHWLHETWASWLAYEAHKQWSDPAIANTEPFELLQKWLEQSVFDNPIDGTEISAPRLVSRLVKLGQGEIDFHSLANIKISDLEDWIAERGNPLLPAPATTLLALQTSLSLQEIVATAKERARSVPADQFIHELIAALEHYTGKLNQPADQSAYQHYMVRLGDTQALLLRNSLLALTDKLLQRIGLKRTIDLLIDLCQMLEKALQALQHALDHKVATVSTLRSLLVSSSGSVGSLIDQRPPRRGQETATFKGFLGHLTNYLEQRKAEIVLAALINIARSFEQTLHHVLFEMQDWAAALYDQADSFSEQVALHANVKVPESSANQLLLLDEVWIKSIYDQHIAPKESDLNLRLKWHFSIHQHKPWLVLELDGSPLIKDASAGTRNFQRWHEAAKQMVQDEIWQHTIWSYLFSNDTRQRSSYGFEDVQAALAQDIQWLSYHATTKVSEAQAWNHNIFYPSIAMFPEQWRHTVRDITDRLQKQLHGVLTAVDILDRAHIIRLSSLDLIRLDALDEYVQQKRAYQQNRLRPGEHERLSVLPGEVQAARLEALLYGYEKVRVIFSPSVVSLLADIERFELFIRAEAFGLIQLTPIADTKAFLLVLPPNAQGETQVCRLTDLVSTPDIVQAILRFSANRRITLGSSGKQPHSIDYEVVKQALHQTLSARAAWWETVGEPERNEEPWTYIKRLQRQKKTYLIAPLLAEAELLESYFQKRIDRINSGQFSSDTERDLLYAASTVARYLFEKIQTDVRDITWRHT